ncbi:MAG: 2-polyprenyl-6-methoxyphenol hydroxylase and related FAD-dependent oxidoreductases, partial [uncultured Rubrobacteraceae bacterium]
ERVEGRRAIPRSLGRSTVFVATGSRTDEGRPEHDQHRRETGRARGRPARYPGAGARRKGPQRSTRSLLHRRRRSGGGDAGAAAGPQGGRRARAGEARRLPEGLPGGHHPPLDDGNHGRTQPGGEAAPRQAHQGATIAVPNAPGDRYRGRLPPPQDALPLRRVHAPVGLPRLRYGRGEALPELPPGDERRGQGGWRVGIVWYLAALFGLLASMVLLGSAFSDPAPLEVLTERWSLLFTLFLPEVLFPFLFIQIFEEVGWTAFMQHTLQERRGPLVASVLVAPAFVLQHLPILLMDAGIGLASL